MQPVTHKHPKPAVCEGFLKNPWILKNAALLEEIKNMMKLQKKCYIEGLKSGEFGIDGINDEYCYESKFLVRCLIARDFI